MDQAQYNAWVDQANEVARRIEKLISMTPTSVVRNAICDANILINQAICTSDELVPCVCSKCGKEH